MRVLRKVKVPKNLSVTQFAGRSGNDGREFEVEELTYHTAKSEWLCTKDCMNDHYET